jgi:hypothetical protein
MVETQRVCADCPVEDLCQQIAVSDQLLKLPREQKDELCNRLLDVEISYPMIADHRTRLFGSDCWMRPNYRHSIIDLLLNESYDTTF